MIRINVLKVVAIEDELSAKFQMIGVSYILEIHDPELLKEYYLRLRNSKGQTKQIVGEVHKTRAV